MILTLHKNKMPEHGGSVFQCERIQSMGVDGHNRLMLKYFCSNLVYPGDTLDDSLG
jgi:hypothetical protein